MPIPPTTIRSLGATAPSFPKAELGMIVGVIAATPAAAAAVLRNRRRGTCTACFDMVTLLVRVGVAGAWNSGRRWGGPITAPTAYSSRVLQATREVFVSEVVGFKGLGWVGH